MANCEQIYFLGIDGGGTKTTLLLTDSDGNTFRKLYTDRSNPMDIGVEACTVILKEGIYKVCEGIPLTSVVIYAGIAGCTAVKTQLLDFLHSLPVRMAACDSDNTNIMQAALGDRDGVTVIMGTGICAWARIHGESYRTGGWGYLINDGGSAFDIGQDALKAYYSSIDGIGEHSVLTKAIGKLYGDDAALLRQTYAGGKKWIASLAPMVYQATQQGDSVARNIINRNMAVAARMIQTAVKRFPAGPVNVVITGGLTNQPSLLDDLYSAMEGHDHLKLSILETEPVMGAVALAHKLWEQGK